MPLFIEVLAISPLFLGVEIDAAVFCFFRAGDSTSLSSPNAADADLVPLQVLPATTAAVFWPFDVLADENIFQGVIVELEIRAIDTSSFPWGDAKRIMRNTGAEENDTVR